MTTAIVKPERTKGRLSQRRVLPYLFVSPFFIIFGIFGLYPFISGFSLAMLKRDEFAGFENFVKLLGDSRFWKSIQNAAIYTCGSVFIILPIALMAALMLHSKFISKVRNISSTIFFLPNVTSVLVIGIVFKFLLRTNNGPVNELLRTFGLIRENIKFLSDPRWAIPSLVLIGSWRYFGINSLFFLSGLQGIPAELNESARIDGAGPIKEFAFITFPLLRPIMTYIVFTAIVGSFSMFGEVMTLTSVEGTGARDSMLFPLLYLYNMMFRNNQMNMASAMGYILAVILLIITTVQRTLMRERD